ncbi:MAG: HAMP domain-containing sensor histidine kinase [Microthrixaceae bacterium]
MNAPMSSAAIRDGHETNVMRRRSPTGLRGRITLAVMASTLLISVIMALVTLTVGRKTLLDSREASLIRQATSNAATFGGSLKSSPSGTETSDQPNETSGGQAAVIQSILDSLPVSGWASAIIPPTSSTGTAGQTGGAGQTTATTDLTTVSINPKYGTDILPKDLVSDVVENRQNRVMRFSAKGEPLIAAGIAVPDSKASYFQIVSLTDIDDALSKMRTGFFLMTVLATVLAAGLGYWSSGYSLRPLRRISDAAKEVAIGQMDTRINFADYANDAELAPLVTNFNDMLSALQDRIDRDARFASDVSHELRSPLTTLNASVEVLQNAKDALPERSQTALELLSSDMRRFTQLVEDLLEISRFDAGAVRLDLDTVALVPTLEKVVKVASSRAIPVIAEPEVTDLVISCDKRRLVRVVTNFIDNAAKYADGATSITVGVGAEPDPETGAVGTIEIGVEDEGPGVPLEQRGKIFDRFNRGDQGGSRGIDMGVGLGLALAAEHARLQGGNVWVEDRHDGGHGSRFVLELPAIEAMEPEELEALSATPGLDMTQITGQVPVVRQAESPGGQR